MDYKARFLDIYHSQISRAGSQELLSWLEKTDFFTAPASTLPRWWSVWLPLTSVRPGAEK